LTDATDWTAACERIVDALYPLALRLDGSFEADTNTVCLAGAVRTSAELEHDVFAIYHELPFHVPLPPGMRYRLRLDACGDDALTQKLHDVTVEAPVDAMPDTGPMTREAWEQWSSQVTYTLDGQQRPVPAPEDFYDE